MDDLLFQHFLPEQKRLPGFDGYLREALPDYQCLLKAFWSDFDTAKQGDEVQAFGLLSKTDAPLPAADEEFLWLQFYLDEKFPKILLVLEHGLARLIPEYSYVRVSGKLVSRKIGKEWVRGIKTDEAPAYAKLPTPEIRLKGIQSIDDILADVRGGMGADLKQRDAYSKIMLYSLAGSRATNGEAGGVGVLYTYREKDKESSGKAFDKFSKVIPSIWFPSRSINQVVSEFDKTIVSNAHCAPHNFASGIISRTGFSGSMSWDLLASESMSLSQMERIRKQAHWASPLNSDIPLPLEPLSTPEFNVESNELRMYAIVSRDLINPIPSPQAIAFAEECDRKLRIKFNEESNLYGEKIFNTLRVSEAIAKAHLDPTLKERYISEAMHLLEDSAKIHYKEQRKHENVPEAEEDALDQRRHLRNVIIIYRRFRGRTEAEYVKKTTDLLGYDEQKALSYHEELYKLGWIFSPDESHWFWVGKSRSA